MVCPALESAGDCARAHADPIRGDRVWSVAKERSTSRPGSGSELLDGLDARWPARRRFLSAPEPARCGVAVEDAAVAAPLTEALMPIHFGIPVPEGRPQRAQDPWLVAPIVVGHARKAASGTVVNLQGTSGARKAKLVRGLIRLLGGAQDGAASTAPLRFGRARPPEWCCPGSPGDGRLRSSAIGRPSPALYRGLAGSRRRQTRRSRRGTPRIERTEAAAYHS
jgi:hypothetical protein